MRAFATNDTPATFRHHWPRAKATVASSGRSLYAASSASRTLYEFWIFSLVVWKSPTLPSMTPSHFCARPLSGAKAAARAQAGREEACQKESYDEAEEPEEEEGRRRLRRLLRGVKTTCVFNTTES